MIIGMSGFARSGKDAAAEYLVEEHGFIRIAFADKLRDFLYALNPYVSPTEEKYFGNGSVVPVKLTKVIDEYGWDHYKETKFGDEIRRLLQRLGTEAGRQTLWDTIWIDAALKDLDPNKNYVVSDARFLNEFAAIEERGGVILRVNRPGVGPANDHASETEALQYDFKYIIDNDGTLSEYYRQLDAFVEHLGG